MQYGTHFTPRLLPWVPDRESSRFPCLSFKLSLLKTREKLSSAKTSRPPPPSSLALLCDSQLPARLFKKPSSLSCLLCRGACWHVATRSYFDHSQPGYNLFVYIIYCSSSRAVQQTDLSQAATADGRNGRGRWEDRNVLSCQRLQCHPKLRDQRLSPAAMRAPSCTTDTHTAIHVPRPTSLQLVAPRWTKLRLS